MGNCLTHRSSMKKVSSDESLEAPPDQFPIRKINVNTRDAHTQEKFVMMSNIEEEEEGILSGDNDQKTTSSTSGSSSTKIVKIKITKKQLLELLGKVEVAELSMQQILSQLMNVTAGGSHKSSSSYEAYDQGSWRPNLQSIPE